MDETERLTALVGDIYDAVLDPSVWPEVLRRCASFVGGTAAALYWKDATRRSGEVYYHDGGIEPRYQQLYFREYIRFDPTTTAHYFAEVGEPIATADILPDDEFLKTRFYQEWARPQRLVDHISIPLDKSDTGVSMFGVFRHERDGLADEETRRRMRLIAPHIRRAVLIGRVLDHSRAEVATFSDALDRLSAGMFLVDANGEILHANVAGHAMLCGGVLRASGRRLVACDSQADLQLHDAFSAAGKGDRSIGVKGIAITLSSNAGERHVAHVLPLTSGARRHAGAKYAAAAAIFVHKAALHAPLPPEVIAKSFRLTPTELRVLPAIVEIGGVPETAEALGVAESTVKTHLSRLYAKMGAHRQADLVKLVAGFSNPLLN